MEFSGFSNWHFGHFIVGAFQISRKVNFGENKDRYFDLYRVEYK